MPSVRKIYKQGTTPVVSLPPVVLRAVGAHLGSHLIIYPITDVALIAEVHNVDPGGLLNLDRIRQMRRVICRTIYRQGNSFVCSISAFILDSVGIGIGDFISIQTLSENAMSFTARSAAQITFDQAQGRVSYRKAERANQG